MGDKALAHGLNDSMKPRDYRIDNIRFILIFLVVFTHFLEIFPGEQKDNIYNFIYTFHMPAFIFLTGYFSRFNRKKIFKNFVVLYFVFQYLYIMFDFYILGNKEELILQYTTPYWIMWYLLSIIFYFLLIPTFKITSWKKAFIIFGGTVIIAILAGFDKTIGYYFSLSRTLVFMPFFVAGYYVYNLPRNEKLCEYVSKYKKLLLGIAIFVALMGAFLIYYLKVPSEALYGSYSYVAAKSSAVERILIGVTAFSWIAVLMAIVPNKRIALLTDIGQNTILIYLLHGFIWGLVWKYELLYYSQGINVLIAFLVSCIIVLLLGNKFVGKFFKKFLT